MVTTSCCFVLRDPSSPKGLHFLEVAALLDVSAAPMIPYNCCFVVQYNLMTEVRGVPSGRETVGCC